MNDISEVVPFSDACLHDLFLESEHCIYKGLFEGKMAVGSQQMGFAGASIEEESEWHALERAEADGGVSMIANHNQACVKYCENRRL